VREAGGANPPESKIISSDAFERYILEKQISERWKLDLVSNFHKIMKKANKSIYLNTAEFVNYFRENASFIISKRDYARLARMLFNYAFEAGFISIQEHAQLKRIIKPKGCIADNYCPTNEEIRATLSKLPEGHKALYLALLYSGIRLSELAYLLKNKQILKVQQMDGFVKAELAYNRGCKRSNFAYMPLWLWERLNGPSLSIEALKSHLKRHTLIPTKYARKWFYTAAISINIPEGVVDYYQGRTNNNVGARHYLGRQQLADQYYPKFLNTHMEL
jgi:intergrase/recombinase